MDILKVIASNKTEKALRELYKKDESAKLKTKMTWSFRLAFP